MHETRDVVWLHRMHYQKDEQAMPDLQVSLIREAADDSVPDVAADGDEEESGYETADDENGQDQGGSNAPAEIMNSEEVAPAVTTTRSGRVVQPPARLMDEFGGMQFSKMEQEYFAGLKEAAALETDESEIACVGAGLGGGFESTNELHVLKYKDAMASSSKPEWEAAVAEEHARMQKHNVWEPVSRSSLPEGTKPLTSTWAMKKKANGKHRARLNARGFQQVPGRHYDAKSISSPVTNDVTIRIVLTLLLMAGWHAEIVDVKGAFLHGVFGDGEVMHMEVPEGFEKYYQAGVVLRLLKTLYGLKQAALAFWRELLTAMLSMGFSRSKADPCLYFQWTASGLVIWLSWIDDCLCVGQKAAVMKAKTEMMKRFDCDDVGELKEYVGCKIDRFDMEGKPTIKITQPVLIQSFADEFGLDPTCHTPSTPAAPGSMLMKPSEDQLVDGDMQTKYRSGVGKMLHLMRWSRPETQNAVRDLSRFMSGAAQSHVKAMLRAMSYCLGTAERGIVLQPTDAWDGSKDKLFIIRGSADSNYATDPDSRKSVSGYSVFLEGAPVAMRSVGARVVALSVTEAELYAATLCAQEMMYVTRILESIGLQVQKPMVLEIDNEGAVDLINNWSVGGRTKHIEVRQYFLRELKEAGVIVTSWKAGASNESDLFTKNLSGVVFNKHAKKFVGSDQYNKLAGSE